MNNVVVDIVGYGDGIEADLDGETMLKSFMDNVTSSYSSFVISWFRNFIHQLGLVDNF